MDSTDPLSELIQADIGAVDRDMLKGILEKFVVFSAEGTVSFLKPFYELSNQQKILLVLVAQKAKSLLFSNVEESMGPSTLISLQVMAEGSAKSSLKRLLETTHEVKKDNSGKYYVPNYLLGDMKKRLEKEG